MSKKDKSKFRKRIKAEILKQMAQSQSALTTPTAENIVQKTPASASTLGENLKQEISLPLAPENDPISPIRKDLKKSGLIISCMIIVVASLMILDLKTGLILKASDWLFQIFKIQI
ncbi:MAG: hypothetical protein AAB785_01020 [Patescibacteria group bacterium]